MPWNRWYSFKSYVRSALWLIPFIALVVGVALKRLSEWFGNWAATAGWWERGKAFLELEPAEAQAFLDRIFSINISFLVFTFGSLLVAIQVAGGQYTPRIIATTLLRDNVIRGISGIFVFTLLWSNRTMVQLSETHVPQLQVLLAGIFGVISLVAFLFLIDYAARFLRPVSLVARVGENGIDVIHSVYPTVIRHGDVAAQRVVKRRLGFLHWPARVEAATASVGSKALGKPGRTIVHQGNSGIVLAVNIPSLIAEAQRAQCVIEVAPQVGDFVAVDEPLFHIYGNAGVLDERKLRALIAFGSERTMEQDPLFALRILVDIALKALSPAINDPTTAVLSIDQLHRLLRTVGLRNLRTDEFADYSGQLRVILRTPNWENFVHLSFREIRQYGASSLQIVRRLHAMIDNLKQTLPDSRHAALQIELDLLNRAAAKHFVFSEDLALARVPDAQGLGGAARAA